MLFAQEVLDAMPDPTALGSAMHVILYLSCSVSAVVIAVATVWALITKSRSTPRDSEFVTRGELARDLVNLKVEMNRDFTRLELQIKELLAQEKEQMDYVRQRTHDQNERQHTANLRMHYMLNIITQLARKADIPVPPEPVISPNHEA